MSGGVATLYGAISRAADGFTGNAWTDQFDFANVSPKPSKHVEFSTYTRDNKEVYVHIDYDGVLWVRYREQFTINKGDVITLYGISYPIA